MGTTRGQNLFDFPPYYSRIIYIARTMIFANTATLAPTDVILQQLFIILLGIFAPVMVTNTNLCPYQLISAVHHENLINVTRLVYTNVIASYLMKNCARVYRNISAE